MKIKNIKKIEYNGDVFNLRVKSNDGLNHNYIANKLNVSNCHKAKSTSIKTILEKCEMSTRRFGVSGTIQKKGSLDRLTIMAHTGPIIQNISADYLIKKGYITPVEVFQLELDYVTDDVKLAFSDLTKTQEDRKRLLGLEQNYVVENEARLDFVTDMILKNKTNSLVLFYRISYGQKIYEMLRNKTNRDVFYVDGNIDKLSRKDFKAEMEQGEGKILIASYGTFSTGINVTNLHTIYMTESFKSPIIVRQSIGRGLRKHKTKDKLLIIDFVDDFRIGKFKNYLYKHAETRREIYAEQNFPFKIKRINLNKL